jgi:hypothetical protein
MRNSKLIVITRRLLTPDKIPGINIAAWFSAMESGSVILDGTTASQWSDISGNNRHATQATKANQPTYTPNGLNGKPVLTFDGVNDNMAVNYNYAGNAATLYAVAARLPGGSSEQWVFSSYDGMGGSLIAPMWVKGMGTDQWSSFGGNGQVFVSGGAILPTNGQGFMLGIDSSITDAVLNLYTNGDLTAQHPGTVRFNGVGARNFIGAEVDGASRFLSGYVTEIVQIESRISTTDRQRLEGYLAWKWGLQANLVNNHPFKFSPPYI